MTMAISLSSFRLGVNSLLRCAPLLSIQHRDYKHYNPKFKKLRGQKVIKVNVPEYEELNEKPEAMSKEELRAKMKERGVLPERYWNEKPTFISSTGGIFEPYVPPEGDGKVSMITPRGAKQKLELVEKKGKSMMALRKIRSFEEDFEYHVFLKEAQQIYCGAHQAISERNQGKLLQLITERAYPEVANNIGDKTIRWTFLESIEPPKVVHLRCTDVISKENIFAQITVRFHTKQMLAVYDRFGRLIHGSESVAKDVLEYVVFEKHLANKYGAWRIHDKIIPNWMPPQEPLRRTQMLPEEEKALETLNQPSNKKVTAAP